MTKIQVNDKLIEDLVKASIELSINTLKEMAEKINEKEKD